MPDIKGKGMYAHVVTAAASSRPQPPPVQRGLQSTEHVEALATALGS